MPSGTAAITCSGYSLLFAPVAVALGPAWVGVLSALAAVAIFTPLARVAASSVTAGATASWLFTAGVLSNVMIGRMPFLLGIALGVGAWAAARARRRVLTGVLGLATMLASPVAGVFLLLGAVAKLLADGRAGAARRGLARSSPRWPAGSRSTSSSPRAGPIASPLRPSGRCW